MTEIKLFGMALIIISAAAIGCIFADRAKREIKALSSLSRCLMVFESEIRYCNTPLREICARIYVSGELWSDFFGYVSEMLSENDPDAGTGIIWETGAGLFDAPRFLSAEDREEFLRFGNELGKNDRESELGRINMYIDHIKNRLSLLEKNINERVRLCRLLGVTAGVFITILMV